MDKNCFCRAHLDTIAAPNTLCMCRVFADVHIHFANTAAFSAGNTFILVHFVVKQRKPVKQGIKCPKKTQPFAKWTIKQYAKYNHPSKDQEFPPKEGAKGRSNTAACKGKWNTSFQDSLRTNVLTEVWYGNSRVVCYQYW